MSSGLPPPGDNVPWATLSKSGCPSELCTVEDEEFPSDLRGNYDWMLQPASQYNARRAAGIVAVLLAAFLIAISIFVVHKLSNPSPAVFASPASPLR